MFSNDKSVVLWLLRQHGSQTQAKSLDELMQRIKEAILLCLEVGVADIEYSVGM